MGKKRQTPTPERGAWFAGAMSRMVTVAIKENWTKKQIKKTAGILLDVLKSEALS